jgi:glycosyltransferase involved in cell wall biosynthesis
MKIDLHVHSKYSRRPSEWILKKLDCPESFTEPPDLYRLAKARGMSQVTITDHNTIEGCLDLADLADVFISEEVTTYFPEDGCKLHVLVYDIDEKIHEDIQRTRENVFDLVAYLKQKNITHSLAHPLYSVNGRLTIENFEKTLLLFKNFEQNGARGEYQNMVLQEVLSTLTSESLDLLAAKHELPLDAPLPWIKNLTGGSDDHSSLTIACGHTEVAGAKSREHFFEAVDNGAARVVGAGSTPLRLARNLYGIAYQYYQCKFGLEKYLDRDVMFKFLDRFLRVEQDREPRIRAKLNSLWQHHARRRTIPSGTGNLLEMLRDEIHRLIWDDPQVSEIFKNGNGHKDDLDRQWFDFVVKVSNRVLFHFSDHMIESLSGAHFFNLFHSIGSAGALYAVLSPYFVSFSVFSTDRKFAATVHGELVKRRSGKCHDLSEIRVGHFTDTFYEINGVAGTLRNQVEAARRTGKHYTVITCDSGEHSDRDGIRNFCPVGVYELSVYPEQKLFYPPFLEMLNYCYQESFTHIHSATPGPMGLAALAIARILGLPFVATYHTALPQYALYLTEDKTVTELVWRYVLWYYAQAELIFVPSVATGTELARKGIDPSRIRVFPRGVNTKFFHPRRRHRGPGCPGLCADSVKLLYVGRISQEKNLHVLASAFRKLAESVSNVELVVVGDGPYWEEMKRTLAGTPCTFTGYLQGEELADVYASCDIFVFPSTTDTFGNVVLEAQASGLPVVVTDCGGPQEIIVPGKTGLVAEGNNSESLLAVVLELVRTPDLRRRMGEAARRHVEDRSFDTAFRKAWDLYAQADGTAAQEFNDLTAWFHGKTAASNFG